ncbi:hypothetical protein Acsp01_41320 [Actinoplanes sp. NBRC 101535]|nr:hypothetical protein Acsp01_41320 [Actinoplanes sp. NBRC 101535]
MLSGAADVVTTVVVTTGAGSAGSSGDPQAATASSVMTVKPSVRRRAIMFPQTIGVPDVQSLRRHRERATHIAAVME